MGHTIPGPKAMGHSALGCWGTIYGMGRLPVGVGCVQGGSISSWVTVWDLRNGVIHVTMGSRILSRLANVQISFSLRVSVAPGAGLCWSGGQNTATSVY